MRFRIFLILISLPSAVALAFGALYVANTLDDFLGPVAATLIAFLGMVSVAFCGGRLLTSLGYWAVDRRGKR